MTRFFSTKLEPEPPEITREITADFSELASEVFFKILKSSGFEMKQLINQSPATGNRYPLSKIEGGTKQAVASSPGNPPRNQTFALNRSIRSKRTGKLEGEIEMLWYGLYHDERGRPFIDKAITESIEREL